MKTKRMVKAALLSLLILGPLVVVIPSRAAPTPSSPLVPAQQGSWSLENAPSDWHGSYLSSVDMISSTEGWAVGHWGGILHYLRSVGVGTPDVGVWYPAIRPPLTHTLTSVDVVSSSDGWAVGIEGTILHYDGTSWQMAISPITDPPIDLDWVDMVSSTDGWAVGAAGTIIHYDGTSWQEVASPVSEELFDVDMMSSSDGWAVGYNGTIIHYDGTSWQEVASPVPEEILFDVDMVSSTDGWAVGTSGTIIHYDGTNWETVVSPTSRDIAAVDMVSSTDGWAVGPEILHYSNGTWQAVDVDIDATGDGDAGLVDIEMVSPTEGWAVGIGRTIIHYTESGSPMDIETPGSATPIYTPLLLFKEGRGPFE